MYLKRKIDKWLLDWKNSDDKTPALIVGIRQCGKTKSIIEFGKKNYKNIIEINFWNNPKYNEIFNGSLDVDTIISNISLFFPEIIIESSNTLLFFDEIQECPRARLSFKNFKIDGCYDVIGSGSYLGINGYNIGDSTPAPTGYDVVYNMHTFDFEEFLWANSYTEDEIMIIEDAFFQRKAMSELKHEIFKELFNKFICVGGFPSSVSDYVKNHNLMNCFRINESIVFDIKSDFGRRKGKDGNPVFKTSEVSRIQNVFDLLPTFLAKEKKRFVKSKISSGSSQDKIDAIEYLNQAHIVNKVYNLENVSLPLLGNKIQSQFKLFPEDISIITSMYGIDTIIAIKNGDLGQAKGAVYESIVFDSLNKADIDVYYFAKESGLEIDFVIAYQSNSCLIEAKAKNGNTKSSKTVMAHPEHYGKTRLIKIGDYNVGEVGDILTIPHYMTFMIGKTKTFNYGKISK